MLKKVFFITLSALFCILSNTYATSTIDSLKKEIAWAMKDSLKYNLNIELAREYLKTGSSEAIIYTQAALKLAEEMDDVQKIINAKFEIGGSFYRLGNYNRSIKNYYDILTIYEEQEITDIGYFSVTFNIGLMYQTLENYKKAREYYFKTLKFSEFYLKKNDSSIIKTKSLGRVYNNIGVTYSSEGNIDSALLFYNKVLIHVKETGEAQALPFVYNNFGKTYQVQKKYDSAFAFYEKSLGLREQTDDYHGIALTNLFIGECHSIKGEYESALKAYVKTYDVANKFGFQDIRKQVSGELINVYNKIGDLKKANEMYKLNKAITDSLNIVESSRMALSLEMQYTFDKYQQEIQIEKEKTKFRNILAYSILGFLFIFATLLFILNRNKVKRIELERNKIELERKALSDQVLLKNKELTSKLMYLIGQNELIDYIGTHLHKNIKNFKKANQEFIFNLARQINERTNNSMWDEFELLFKEVNESFYKNLLKAFPNLSTNEKKLCAFLRLNMSTKDISAITHQTHHTINIARSRLRKKLGIDNLEISLNDFLMEIDDPEKLSDTK